MSSVRLNRRSPAAAGRARSVLGKSQASAIAARWGQSRLKSIRVRFDVANNGLYRYEFARALGYCALDTETLYPSAAFCVSSSMSFSVLCSPPVASTALSQDSASCARTSEDTVHDCMFRHDQS